jgi:hypothetical protein
MNHAPVPGGATGLADILGLNDGESVITIVGASDGLNDSESEGLVEVRVEGVNEGEEVIGDVGGVGDGAGGLG